MRGISRGAVVMVGALQACAPSNAPEDDGREANQGVELFARGVVSSELPEFAISFTPSGDTAFFNRTPPDRSRIDLLFSTLTDTGWTSAVPFAPLEGVRAIDPFVTVDGAYLYFSSDLPIEGRAEGSFNLWRLALGRSGATPEPLPFPINTDSSEVFNSISASGRMVFSSRRDGDRRIYESQVEPSGMWAEPARLSLGAAAAASNPALHPSGRYMVFARADDGGPSDLFVSCSAGQEWTMPVRLPEPINSPFTEFAPGFGGGYLYFTSERPGVRGPVPDGERPPGDVYRVRTEGVAAVCDPTPGSP